MMIRIHQGKGRPDRDVPLSPKRLETLRLYWYWSKPKTYLFPGPSLANAPTSPITANIVWLVCRQAAEQAGFDKIIRTPEFIDAGIDKPLSPHSLRHTLAS